MGIERPLLLTSGSGVLILSTACKSLENELEGMGVGETYSEPIELLYEGMFSRFGQTYPFVFRGENLDLGQGD
jgi:hypothetical protein